MNDKVIRVPLRALPWAVQASTSGKAFKGEKLKAYQKLLASMITPHVGEFVGPVKLDVLFVFARGVGRAKEAKKTGERVSWHTVKPDRDNCLKAVQDALKDIWPDDCVVVDGVTSKVWGSKDEIFIRIGPAEPVESVTDWFGWSERKEKS